MEAERWERLQRLFHRAAELEPRERRRELRRECEGDETLVEEVLSLLASSESDTRAMGESIAELAGELSSTELRPGDLVGSYRVVRELGRGGMGIVYLAERVGGEFEQQVALKVLSGVVTSPTALDRFLAERRILAQLEHPNIARLLDGGTTGDGAPFFAMEVAQGEPIDRYCDRRRLDTRERLRLFLAVCDAVQYAHRRLVIHRDLKPANILVTPDGEPKLLDFGIAKLVDPALGGTGSTLRGELPMTPEYASPEQVRGEMVSTATDVYGLGLLLYELLTGRRAHHLASRNRQDVERAVCLETPTRPSAVVSRLGEVGQDGAAVSSEAIAAARGSTPARLRRRLRGDLDTIVLAALRKEPERRYPSVTELAEDLRRHLEGRPVRARGDALGYRAAKFVRRHAVGVAASVAVVSALLVAAIALWIGLERARAAERLAEAEARTAEEVADFLAEMLGSADPRDTGGNEPTVRDVLERGAERIDALSEQRRVQSRLLIAMGEAYFALGRFDDGASLLERAIAGADPEDPRYRELLIEAIDLQVPILTRAGRLDEALTTAERAADLAASMTAAEAFDHARALNALAVALMDGGDFDRARAVNREVLSLLGDAQDPESRRARAVTLNQLGAADRRLGELDSAAEYLRRALELTVGHAELGYQRALILRDLGLVHKDLKNPEEARRLLERSLDTTRRVYGDAHPSLLGPLLLLGDTEVSLGRLEAAEDRFTEAFEIAETSIGRETPNYAMTLFYHSRLLAARSRYEDALDRLERAIEIGDATMGRHHPNVLRFRVARGEVLAKSGREGAASTELQSIAEEVRESFGPEHEVTRTLEAVISSGGSTP